MRKKRSIVTFCVITACLWMIPLVVCAQKTSVTVTVKQTDSYRVIHGKVVDEDGHSLPGVNVSVKGVVGGTISDVDGNFKISAPRENTVLKFTFVGMKTKEVSVKANENEIQVLLEEETNEINEVIVTGYGNLRRESFTGNAITVKKDELLKVNKTNVIAALQAFDPSFRIAENINFGSDPNALPDVSLRGKSSFGAGEFNADGEPIDVTNKQALMDNPNLPTFIMDGFEISVTKLYDFDPSRIESVTILRDAAATAMYGSRAANGVVVITTVAPKPGKLNVSYSLTGELEFPDLTDYNLMNAAEKLEAERLSGAYDSTSPVSWAGFQNEYNAKLYNVRNGVDTYWLSKPLRTVFNTIHSLYVDGGTEKVRFGAEMNFNKGDGVMKGSKRDVWGVGTYIDYRIGNLQVRNHTTYNVTHSAESPYGSFSTFAQQLPYDVYIDAATGRPMRVLNMWHSMSEQERLNPMYEATLMNRDESSYEELINNLSVQWVILDGLLFKSTLGLTRQFSSSERFYDPNSMQNSNPLSFSNLSSGELLMGDGDSFSWDWQASLSYNRFIKEHNVNASLIVNMKEDRSTSTSTEYWGFPSGALSSPNYAQEVHDKPQVSESHNRLIGITGLVNYSFQDIYLFDASLRMDGSSQFGSDKRFAPFWSLGAGLNLHNYQFMKDLNVIDLLKVRASYGQTGKVNFSSFEARTTYRMLTDEWYKTGYGATLYALGNHNLKWETTNQLDVGAEIRLWNGKFYLRGNYYNKRTVNTINDVTIPSHTGFTTYKDNIGEIENRGFELDFRSEIINTRDWYVAVYANLAHNENKILKVAETLKDYNARVDAFLNDPAQQHNISGTKTYKKYQEGGSESSIWAMQSLGIDPATGEELFLTPDGKVTNIWNSTQQVVVGTTEPDAQGSFGINARWKNFSIYATFMYQWGGQTYNSTLVEKVENVNVYDYNADRRVLTGRWQKPGDVTAFKKLESGRDTGIDSTQPTSRFVQDYNWLSLNSLTLGYDFDQKLIQPLHLTMLRFEVGANDLFRISTVEQERGLSYPYSRTINFSLKASF